MPSTSIKHAPRGRSGKQQSPSGTSSGVLIGLLILTFYGILILIRVPEIALNGRFWAEEGSVYFAYAYGNGFFKSAFAPHPGYYMLFPSLATTVAAHFVSLEHAPSVTVGASFLVQMLAPVLILTSPIKPLADPRLQIAALAILMFALPNQEIWLTTTNSQFYMPVCAALVLISTPARQATRVFHLIAVLLAGLSGVASTFLAPFFWLRAYQERSRTRVVQASLLTLCVAIQAALFLIAPLYGFAAVGHSGRRHLVLNPWVLSHAVFAKDILLPLVGHQWTNTIMRPLGQAIARQDPSVAVLMLALAWGGCVGLLAYRSGLSQARLLAAAALSIALLSCTASVEATNASWYLSHVSALGAGRYYYAPNALLTLALLVMSTRQSSLSPRLKNALLALVAWTLLVGCYEYMRSTKDYRWFFTGPNWQREVAMWRGGQARELKIWPVPWKIGIDSPSNSDPARRSPGGH